MTFAEASALLTALGITFSRAYEYRGEPGKGRDRFELDLISQVDPNFEPVDWVRIASRAGDGYIGGCCGSSSAIQDVICDWFRQHPDSIPIDELSEVAAGMTRHDGKESHFSQPPTEWLREGMGTLSFSPEGMEVLKLAWPSIDPWDKLAIIWFLVKDNWAPKIPNAYREDMHPADKAVSILARAAQAISFHRFFRSSKDDEGKAPSPTDKLFRAQSLARLFPALKELVKITEDAGALSLGGFEGLALIDIQKGEDHICTNGLGFCVYNSRVDLQEVLDLWLKQDAQFQEQPEEIRIRNRIGIRPVRVSWNLPDGIEFTGPLERLSG